jgi:pSer/pThr/pTyr-binding forkhead associated (FHA) protein
MSADPNLALLEIEKILSDAVLTNGFLKFEDLEPQQIVRQISEDLVKKRFIWLGNETYVPNKLIGYLPSDDPDKMEELEVIFNSSHFIRLLNKYILGRGFKLFNPLKVEIKTGRPAGSEDSRFAVEFDWPEAEEAVEDVTVKLDENQGVILEVYDLQPEISQLARLTIISGEAYRDSYLITKQTTHVGRLRNVIDKDTNKLIRRNDFIFARNLDETSPNSSVSRQHATIMFQNGRFYLYDNGSANGTEIERVGAKPIEVQPGEQGVALENYDIIRFGTALVRFEDNAKLGSDIQKDVSQPRFSESELVGEAQTTVRLTRDQINAEMRKLLDSE